VCACLCAGLCALAVELGCAECDSLAVVGVCALLLPCSGSASAAASAGALCGESGFATGAVGRLLAPRTTPVYLAAAPIAGFALVFLFIGFTARGDLAGGFVDQSLPRLLRMMPVDIAAGALCGTSLGFGFMRSFAAQPGDR
jgi:hypothetical protein